MRSPKVIALTVVFILLAIVIFNIITRKQTKAQSEEKRKVIPVETTFIKNNQMIREAVDLTGQVDAVDSAIIISKVTGRIEYFEILDEKDKPRKDPAKKTALEEGLRVKAGQGIAIIDNDTISAQVNQAEANLDTAQTGAKKDVVEAKLAEAKSALDSAKSRHSDAKSRLENAEKDYRRMESLWKSKAVSEREYDAARTTYLSASENELSSAAEVKRAESAWLQVTSQVKDLAGAQVSQARASLDLAKANLNESIVRSPLSGIITRKFVNRGDTVGLNIPIAKVADISKVKIIAGIPEKYIGRIEKKKTVAEINVDAYPDKTFLGTVEEVFPEADEKTRTFPIKIIIQNNEEKLLPGMFTRIKLILQQKTNCIVIPRDVVLGDIKDGFYVYVNKGKRAQKKSVTMGIIEAGRAEITAGLTDGDDLIVNGMNYIQEGTAIEVVNNGAGGSKE